MVMCVGGCVCGVVVDVCGVGCDVLWVGGVYMGVVDCVVDVCGVEE